MPRAVTAPARHAPARHPARVPRAGRRPAPGRRSAGPLPRGAVVLDALLHGRGWIVLVFALLVGIVFFNVDLLRMNRQIALGEERVGALKRENARLRTDVARLASSERIQRVAAERGLVLPAPGEVRYLRSNPAVDAPRAAARLRAGATAAPAEAQPEQLAAPRPPPPAAPPPTATPPAATAPTATAPTATAPTATPPAGAATPQAGAGSPPQG